MRSIWLVLRLNLRGWVRYDDMRAQSYDGIFDSDYMGSTEFEFGAIPKSFGRIKDWWLTPHYEMKVIEGFIYHYNKKDIDIQEYHKQFMEIKKGTHRTKEYVFLYASKVSDLFMDIDNDVYIIPGDEKCNHHVSSLLRNSIRWNIEHPYHIKVEYFDGISSIPFNRELLPIGYPVESIVNKYENPEVKAKVYDYINLTWVYRMDLKLIPKNKNGKITILWTSGKTEEDIFDYNQLNQVRERLMSNRLKIKRFEIFNLDGDEWVSKDIYERN